MPRNNSSSFSYLQSELSRDRKHLFFNFERKNVNPRLRGLTRLASDTLYSQQLILLMLLLANCTKTNATTAFMNQPVKGNDICLPINNLLLLNNAGTSIHSITPIKKDVCTIIEPCMSKHSSMELPIDRLLKQVVVSIPQDQIDFLKKGRSAAEVKQWRGLIKQFINRIKRLLPETLPETYLRTIFTSQKVAFDVVVSDRMIGGAEAMYAIARMRISILFDTDLSDAYLLQIMRNELYHALIHAVNSAKLQSSLANTSMYNLYPFLNQQGEIDQEKFESHRRALDAGYQRVILIEKLLTRPANYLSENEKNQLNQYFKAIELYVPHEWRMELSQELLSTLTDHDKDRLKFNTIPNRENLFFHKIIPQGSRAITFYTLAESSEPQHKLVAFIRFIKQEFNNSHYQKLADEMKDTEMASFLLELHPDVLREFFGEWYATFTEYLRIDQSKLVCENLAGTKLTC